MTTTIISVYKKSKIDIPPVVTLECNSITFFYDPNEPGQLWIARVLINLYYYRLKTNKISSVEMTLYWRGMYLLRTGYNIIIFFL